MEAIVAFLLGLPFHQIIILSLVFTALYVIVCKLFENDLQNDIYKIKEAKGEELNQFIIGEMAIIEEYSLLKAKEILKDYPDEYLKYSLVLERNLYFDVMEHVRNLIRINHFHHKTGDDLNEYITDKGLVLLACSRKRLNARSHLYPHLDGTDNERFTNEDAIKFYKKIVTKSIDIRNEQETEIKLCKQKYSVLYKINILRMILEKFGGNK